MNVSYRWLKAVAPTLDLTPEELAERLAGRGAPVEEVLGLSEELGDVVIGRVVTTGPHPNADRLSVCQVEGPEGVVQVVCGAPNVKAGSWYPFAPVGATLPGGFTLKRAKIRGEYSNGMLCSEKELGLGRDHAGIMELHGDFEVGQSFVDALGLEDWRLDVEVTANRGDLLSHLGVAREAAPGGEADLVLPPVPGIAPVDLKYVRGDDTAQASGVTIRIEDPDLCFRYLGAVIHGVSVGPSPEWLAGPLRAAGARPINNVVDATNFVLLELGQPLHAFDLSTLEEDTVVVRRARKGERLTTLDDVDRALTREMLMICDARRPVAIAGVMGGAETEVSDGTSDILLECALFHPGNTRSTRRALQMSTDASYRFERGVDPEGMERALTRAVEIILATAGGELAGPVADACPRPWEPLSISLRLRRIRQVLGVDFTADRVGELLRPLGFQLSPTEDDGVLEVRVPGWRSYDVTREVDLIEEIARTHGYDEFPAELGPFRPGTTEDDALFQLQDRMRLELVGMGFLEAQTPAFAPEAEGEVEVMNPISAEESRLRGALSPALLRRVQYNMARGVRDVRLFEIGTVFSRPAKSGKAPAESAHLAAAATGRRRPPHWSVPDEALDIWDLKGWMERVSPALHRASAVIPGTEVEPPAPAHLQIGTALALVDDGGNVVGWGGRVRPEVLDLPAWAGDVWSMEVAFPAEVPKRETPMARPAPAFPGVERDFAVILPSGMTASRVEELIRERAGKHLTGVGIFDVYEGKGIPEGARSVAFRLSFRSEERTLTDKEVDRAAEKVVRALKEEFGVETRGR